MLRTGNSDADDAAYYSEKLAGPAMRYGVAVSIYSSDIVWMSGPFLPGRDGWSPDLIFCEPNMLGDKLKEEGEIAEGGDCYRNANPFRRSGPRNVKCPAYNPDDQSLRRRVQKRNATINDKLQKFGVLKQTFRHGIDEHGFCFRAVAVIVQLTKEGSEELLDTSEYDDTLTDDEVTALFGL